MNGASLTPTGHGATETRRKTRLMCSVPPCLLGGERRGSASMKAMVLTGPGELVLDEVARPEGGARNVLVRVTHSGICGTDYKIFNGSIPVTYPRIMGHEMAGEVVDGGDTTFRAGDRVII